MATNADDVQEDKQVTEADLAALKAKSEEVDEEKTQDESEEAAKEETSEEAEATTGEETGQTDDQTTEEEQSESTFTKPEKFQWVKGDTPQEFAENLMVAYENSTAEALKWKKVAGDSQAKDDTKPVHPALAYAEQKMQEDIDRDIADFSKEFSQMADENQVAKIQDYVGVVSEAIQKAENGRIPSMKECLEKSAAILGWHKTDKQEQVGAAVKNGAATTKTNSATKQTPASKVTDGQILVARKTWGAGKSDSEIRKELEAHV